MVFSVSGFYVPSLPRSNGFGQYITLIKIILGIYKYRNLQVGKRTISQILHYRRVLDASLNDWYNALPDTIKSFPSKSLPKNSLEYIEALILYRSTRVHLYIEEFIPIIQKGELLENNMMCLHLIISELGQIAAIMSSIYNLTQVLTFNSPQSYVGILEAGLVALSIMKSPTVNSPIRSLITTYYTTLITGLLNLENGHYLAKSVYLILLRSESEQHLAIDEV